MDPYAPIDWLVRLHFNMTYMFSKEFLRIFRKEDISELF